MAGRNNDILPYSEDGSTWDANEILRNWSQFDNDSTTDTDAVRCASNAALAMAIMNGPAAVASFAERASGMVELKMNDESAPPDVRAEMALGSAFLLAFVMAGLAHSWTYGSLSRLAHLAKLATSFSGRERNKSKDLDAGDLASLAGRKQPVNRQMPTRSAFEQGPLQQLRRRPGFALMVHVDTGERKRTQTDTPFKANQEQGNHYVTVGSTRDPSPRIYLYDPLPRVGAQLIYEDTNPDDFWSLFETAEKDFKWVSVISVTEPPSPVA